MRLFQVVAPINEDSFDTSNLKILFDLCSVGTSAFPIEGRHRMSRQQKFTFGIITENLSYTENNLDEVARTALEKWEVETDDDISISQSTYNKVFGERSMFSSFDCNAVANRLNAREIVDLFSRNGNYGFLQEYMLDPDSNQERIVESVANSPYYPDLSQEIERIRKDEKVAIGQVPMIPVSYYFKGAIGSNIQPAIRALLNSLYASGRLQSKQVFEFDFDQLSVDITRSIAYKFRHNLDDIITPDFVNSLLGNTVIITYGKYDNGGEFEQNSYRYLQKFLELLNENQHRVQLIFVVPENNPDLEKRLSRSFRMPSISFFPKQKPDIQLNFEAARDYVMDQAAEEMLEVDQELFDLLEASLKDKSINDPALIYSQWRQKKLVENNYPQYAGSVEYEIDKVYEELPSAQERLEELIGLTEVKKVIKQAVLRYRMNRMLEMRGLPSIPFTMHATFMGSPGTGKTEVARLYAEILKEEGVISEGRLITHSGFNKSFGLKKAIEEAQGSVLFIDEAYSLANDERAVTMLIEAMENNRHNFVVVFAGYEKHMNYLISTNPGFNSRIGFKCKFPDYTPEELTRIFALFMNRKQLEMSKPCWDLIRDYCERPGRREDFGNARDIRKLFEGIVGQQQIRLSERSDKKELSEEELLTITEADVLTAIRSERQNHDETKPMSANAQLQAMIGLDEVKTLVTKQINYLKLQKLRRDKGLVTHFKPMHMVFSGNPGTGKTEVAKLMAQILKEEGILSVGELFRCGRQDLVGQHVGQTAPKIASLFQKARGSVIFIDEAYSLLDGYNGYGAEAITAIIDNMEEYRDEVVVILAGYKEETEMLLDSNPGFRSRVKFKIHFPDYDGAELLDILHHMVLAEGFILADGVDEHLLPIFESARNQKNFGNGRFVRNVFENAIFNQANRLLAETDGADLGEQELQTLTVADFPVDPIEEKRTNKIGFSA